jgi:diguanylate cyclase (GGDEF)-like protein
MMRERRANPQAVRDDLDGLVRHVALADWLVLAVIVLYLVVAPNRTFSVPLIGAMVAFAVSSTLLRAPNVFGDRPGMKLALQTWATVAFVTFIAWQTGGADSPLQSLYLLPIVLAALVLPTLHLAAVVTAVAAGYLLNAAFASALPVLTPEFGGRLFGAIGPFVLVAWLTSQLGTAVLAARRRANELVETDPLTGLANRAVFDEALEREQAVADRRRVPYAVLVLDVQGLKRINDALGSEAGDAALTLVANVLRRTLRETDVAARWGGDEFAVLLPAADIGAANAVGQRIRNAVHAATLDVGAKVIRCSLSFGSAAAPRDGEIGRDLVRVAESRLQKDKQVRAAAAAQAQPAG